MAKNSTVFGQRREFSANMPAVNAGGNIPTVQFSSGNARALQQFSRTLFGLSSQFEDQLDQTAEAEAAKEGAIAGLSGNTEEQSYETIRGRAYNRAMLETFVTSLDTRAMVGIAERQQQYYNDPVRLEKSLNDFLGGIADEVEKVAPGAGASFVGRQTARAIPAVEAARDERVRQTRDEAAANITLYEASLMGEIRKNATGLFSNNPAQSAAASASVAQSMGEYLRMYDAIDPVTNKPAFTQAEKAQAEVYIKDRITTEAALGWFDAQEDPDEAYMKLTDPDAAFKINMPGQKKAKVVHANQGKTRNLPVRKDVLQKLELAGGATGDGIEIHIISGGQVTREEARRGLGRRTGSERHDHGHAADVVLSVNGKQVTPQEAPELYQKFLENAAAAGFTGLGHYAWGVHVGGGSEKAWGPDTTRRTLDPKYAAAIDRGRSRARQGGLQLDPGQTIDVPLRNALTEAAYNKLDAEMRRRITFANTQQDRAAKAEKERIEREQEAAETEVTARIYAAGRTDPLTGETIQPITETEIWALADEGIITQSKAQAFIKAITTEKPERSDPYVYQELQRRMYQGEDVQDDIFTAVDQLSQSDMNALLSKNDSMNRSGAGGFSPEENFHFQQLDKLLTPDTMMADLDPSRQARRYEALDEFRRRAKARAESGEKLDDIARDIAGRATVDFSNMAIEQSNGLVLPRFAVTPQSLPQGVSADDGIRWVDIDATRRQIAAALQSKRITEAEAQEQALLLMRWKEAQDQYLADKAKEAQTNRRGR